MSEISWNSVFDAVSLALHAAFPDRQIHGGEVKQGLQAGDFNVVPPGGAQALEVGRRYRRSLAVDVIYYPKAGRAECHDMADRLAAVLESVRTPEGDAIHAGECQWSVTDDVLHVLLEYPHFACVPREGVMMEILKIEQEG